MTWGNPSKSARCSKTCLLKIGRRASDFFRASGRLSEIGGMTLTVGAAVTETVRLGYRYQSESWRRDLLYKKEALQVTASAEGDHKECDTVALYETAHALQRDVATESPKLQLMSMSLARMAVAHGTPPAIPALGREWKEKEKLREDSTLPDCDTKATSTAGSCPG